MSKLPGCRKHQLNIRLEDKLQANLSATRVVVLRTNDRTKTVRTRTRQCISADAGNHGSGGAGARNWRKKIRLIKRVEQFKSQLNFLGLRDLNVLTHAEVNILYVVSSDVVKSKRQSPQVVHRCRIRRRRI